MTEKPISFRIRQFGYIKDVASGQNYLLSELKIMHSAFEYRQYGDVTIEHNYYGRWKRFALLSQWPPFSLNKEEPK